MKQVKIRPEALKLMIVSMVQVAESKGYDINMDPKDATKLKSSVITWKSFCHFIKKYMPETTVTISLRYPRGGDEYDEPFELPGVKVNTMHTSQSALLNSIEPNELSRLLSRINDEGGIGQTVLVHKIRAMFKRKDPNMGEARLKSKVDTFAKKISVSSLTWKSFCEALEVIDAREIELIARNDLGEFKETVR